MPGSIVKLFVLLVLDRW